MVLLVVLVGLLVDVAGAAASKPVIVSLSMTPRVLPSSGGEVTISGRVRRSVSCTIFYYDGRLTKRTVNCTSGRFSWRRDAPANSGTTATKWSAWIEAHSGHLNTQSWEVAVEVLPSPAAAPPVVNLDACTSGPECDYGAAYQHYETWGNVPPEDLGDCTFAAAANWEQILFNWHVFPTALGYEFAEAGGTEQGGLAQEALWRYWERDGIGGVKLTGLHKYIPSPENVRNGVRDYAAMIVELRFGEGWAFAQYSAKAGLHDVVVMGFTPEGPLVVSWGEVLQLTWEQWSDEVVGMWGVGASNPTT